MLILRSHRRAPSLFACALSAGLLGASSALLGVCGPFTDVAADAFCPFVLELFTLGITTGTTPTTYDPTSSVTRLQMAAFLSRSVDGVLKRGSRRAALDQFWTTQNASVLGLTTVGTIPYLLKSDGTDVWVANNASGTVSRVHGADGRLLETWTGATSAYGVLVAMQRVFVTGGFTSPGNLYRIDPGQPAGAVTTLASTLGNFPYGVAFDGARIWTANQGGSVSIVTPGATIPWTVTTVTTGSGPAGALFDGANIWVTDQTLGSLLKLDSAGAVLQTVTLSIGASYPAFDGANIWVPIYGFNSVSVVRASNGAVLQTLTGNGLQNPHAAAFDGQRVLVANNTNPGSVSLFKAADLSPLGSFPTGSGTIPFGACSDGINFWITLTVPGRLAQF